jgi:hypothetical protein
VRCQLVGPTTPIPIICHPSRYRSSQRCCPIDEMKGARHQPSFCFTTEDDGEDLGSYLFSANAAREEACATIFHPLPSRSNTCTQFPWPGGVFGSVYFEVNVP